MSYFSHTMRRRLFAAALQASDFVLIVDGAEYKPGDTVTILATTTVAVKGTGTAEITLIGGGGGGGSYVGDLTENYNSGGDGGNGGTSIFKQEFVAGTYDIVIGAGGDGGTYSDGKAGGTTTALGHSAGGGGGGTAADDWYEGNPGSDGSGETLSGNTTQYGQGGFGRSDFSGDDGTSGACIIKLIDPNVKMRTITLVGTFNSTSAYVTIGGNEVASAGTYEVENGDVISLAVKSYNMMASKSTIVVDGVTVVTTGNTLATYDYTVESDCTITSTQSGASYMPSYTIAIATT